ncbi:MAG: hypothetical protein WC201_04250 [Bacilli bacterium]
MKKNIKTSLSSFETISLNNSAITTSNNLIILTKIAFASYFLHFITNRKLTYRANDFLSLVSLFRTLTLSLINQFAKSGKLNDRVSFDRLFNVDGYSSTNPIIAVTEN